MKVGDEAGQAARELPQSDLRLLSQALLATVGAVDVESVGELAREPGELPVAEHPGIVDERRLHPVKRVVICERRHEVDAANDDRGGP